MKILILHNAYKLRGGEETVVAAETEMLRSAGHDVHLEVVSNDEISGLANKLRTFLNTPHNPERKLWMKNILDKVQPNIVHIHNFFPILTPAVHEAVNEAGIAVVQTLHNYRLLCAGAQFRRDGGVCELCLGGSRAWGVVHRCYRGSVVGSLAVVRMQARAEKEGTWQNHVQRFIALSEFARHKFTEGGLPADKIAIKSNFVADEAVALAGQSPRAGALFVGRLSPEKGVNILLNAWSEMPDIDLVIAGDGPEMERLQAQAPSNVKFLGSISSDRVKQLMSEAQCLVLPSIWYEGFPMTLVEAFSSALPVIASRLGAMEEIVDDGVTGYHFNPGDADDLRKVVRRAFSAPEGLEQLGRAARQAYEDEYTPDANLKVLESIYADAIAARA